MIKADPFLGLDSVCPPGFRTHLHVTTSHSTGGGPVRCVQWSGGSCQVVYPLGFSSRLSGVVKVLLAYANKLFTFTSTDATTMTRHMCCRCMSSLHLRRMRSYAAVWCHSHVDHGLAGHPVSQCPVRASDSDVFTSSLLACMSRHCIVNAASSALHSQHCINAGYHGQLHTDVLVCVTNDGRSCSGANTHRVGCNISSLALQPAVI